MVDAVLVNATTKKNLHFAVGVLQKRNIIATRYCLLLLVSYLS